MRDLRSDSSDWLPAKSVYVVYRIRESDIRKASEGGSIELRNYLDSGLSRTQQVAGYAALRALCVLGRISYKPLVQYELPKTRRNTVRRT